MGQCIMYVHCICKGFELNFIKFNIIEWYPRVPPLVDPHMTDFQRGVDNTSNWWEVTPMK